MIVLYGRCYVLPSVWITKINPITCIDPTLCWTCRRGWGVLPLRVYLSGGLRVGVRVLSPDTPVQGCIKAQVWRHSDTEPQWRSHPEHLHTLKQHGAQSLSLPSSAAAGLLPGSASHGNELFLSTQWSLSLNSHIRCVFNIFNFGFGSILSPGWWGYRWVPNRWPRHCGPHYKNSGLQQ